MLLDFFKSLFTSLTPGFFETEIVQEEILLAAAVMLIDFRGNNLLKTQVNTEPTNIITGSQIIYGVKSVEDISKTY
jgi:hypothetical protein